MTEEINERKDLLLNTIITKRMLKSDFNILKYGYDSTLALNSNNYQNLSIFFKAEASIILNGKSKVIVSDIETDNSIMHKVNKIIPLPTTNNYIDIDPDLALFNKTTTDYFNFWRSKLIPKLGRTIFTVINSGFYSYDIEFIDKGKSNYENAAYNYDFLRDCHVSNQMIKMENLRTPKFTFISY